MPTSGGEGDWPTLDELKKLLDVQSNDFDNQLGRDLDAAIEQVKLDAGAWDDMVDEPTDSQAAAALLLATRIAKAPGEGIPLAARKDDAYWRLLKGTRTRFSIA